MHFLKLKSLSFYGIAIGSVVALFSLTTAYGESNLKAPPKIAGRYRIAAQTFPGCLKADTLILTIEQSGVYLSGSLLTPEDSTQTITAAKKKPPSLTGLWKPQELKLSGMPSHLPACRTVEGKPPSMVKIKGAINQNIFQGTIHLASIPGSAEFAGQREDLPQKKE